jgi:release factor glutamine methyltransferase
MEDTTNSKELLGRVKGMINTAIDEGEREAIALLVLENETGILGSQLLLGQAVVVNEESLAEKISRINQSEPVQYVLGEAWFFNRVFRVNASVLIPRPETEMIVREVVGIAEETRVKNILDIGTGSGCIAITLAMEIKGSKVTATDVSPAALWVAATNAILHAVSVNFVNHDILGEVPNMKETFDVIVSNPPYVTRGEGNIMAKHVKDFEPHQALFVPDNDPLVFYKAIASQSLQLLNPNGIVIVEINERFGREVGQVFSKAGFGATEILKDIDGKDRIVVAAI